MAVLLGLALQCALVPSIISVRGGRRVSAGITSVVSVRLLQSVDCIDLSPGKKVS